MNKLFSKVATLSVGLAMAIGVGVAVGSKAVKEVRAEETYTDTAFASLVTDDVVVIVGNNGNDYALSNDKGTSSAPSAVAVTVSGTSLSGTIPSNVLWKVTKSNDSIQFTVDGGTAMLYTTNSNNGVRVGTNANNSFEIKDNYLYNTATTRYIGIYNSQDWRCYTSINNNIKDQTFKFFKKASESHGTLLSLAVSGSMTKTKYTTADSWDPSGLTVMGTYDSSDVVDVTSSVTWTYNPSAPALSVTSVVATASIGTVSGSSSAQTVTVSKANQIQAIYAQAAGASIDVYGYYVGYLTHTNKDGTITYYDVIIQDGEYGIMAYGLTTQPTYTINETILHVTGTLSIYKGLYELASPTVSEATSIPQDRAPSAAVVYAAKGGETAEYASRLTTVTGIPSYNGTIGEAGASDLTLTFTVGEKTIQVFYKKAAQTADAEAFAAVKAAVEGSSEVTIKGFTGWYDGFQVQMNGYVPPVEDYTAEDFAQDLLDQTDAVCAGWEEGDNNHDALEAIWSDLASNDKYPSLPAAQKTILAEANRDESGTVVEQAMARYDFLTGKYELSNFINGRTPIVPAGRIDFSNDISQNSSMIIIVSIAAISALAFTMLLVFKKKKQK